jgi:hypothetical protein
MEAGGILDRAVRLVTASLHPDGIVGGAGPWSGRARIYGREHGIEEAPGLLAWLTKGDDGKAH